MNERTGDVFVKWGVIGCAKINGGDGLAIPEEIVEMKVAMGARHSSVGAVNLRSQSAASAMGAERSSDGRRQSAVSRPSPLASAVMVRPASAA